MRTRALASAVVVATTVLAGCASTSERQHSADPVRRGATSPAAAALGFDRSVRAGTHRVAFACFAHNTLATYSGGSGREVRTAVTRSGSTWIVDVTHAPLPEADTRYRVVHRRNGYCVTAESSLPNTEPGSMVPEQHPPSASTSR